MNRECQRERGKVHTFGQYKIPTFVVVATGMGIANAALHHKQQCITVQQFKLMKRA